MKNVAVIIPALDEASTISKVVEGVVSLGCDAFVIDDASSDDTSDLARRAGAEVLRLPFTAGAWCATQAGILHAMKKGKYSAFLTMDGDGQHDPAFIPKLVSALRSGEGDVVIGGYTERGSLARHVAWRFFSFMTGLSVSDLTSGLRIYNDRAAAALLSKQATLYDYQDLGVLLQLRRNGFTFSELAVKMQPRQNGCSRVFSSWWAVAVYMFKTCILILADWIARADDSAGDWRDYDIV